MGCDIHLYVERKLEGRWVTCDKWSDRWGEGLKVERGDSFYRERNYSLFTILAGVRDYSDAYC